METENDLVAVNGGSMTASAGSESVRSGIEAQSNHIYSFIYT